MDDKPPLSVNELAEMLQLDRQLAESTWRRAGQTLALARITLGIATELLARVEPEALSILEALRKSAAQELAPEEVAVEAELSRLREAILARKRGD